MTNPIEALTAAIAMQQKAIEALVRSNGELTSHIGLLVQSVALLLGEELGTPVADDEVPQERVDLDGNPY